MNEEIVVSRGLLVLLPHHGHSSTIQNVQEPVQVSYTVQ